MRVLLILEFLWMHRQTPEEPNMDMEGHYLDKNSMSRNTGLVKTFFKECPRTS